MLIFWDQRLVFLATPKAGSTAIEVALESLASASLLRPDALKHTDIATYRRFVGPWLSAQTDADFTTVALMREPVDWLRSWYRFKLRDDHDDPRHAMDGISFSDFAARYAAGQHPEIRQPECLPDGRRSSRRLHLSATRTSPASWISWRRDLIARSSCAHQRAAQCRRPSAGTGRGAAGENAMARDLDVYASLHSRS
ncbi:sulfotransferase family protein [Paracoccus sp. NBH48]|uniref:sulfotransferase family protein n=1 Tax=Paracoccus sp. NBH48 TaxID=2596918 RepID=UPI0021046EA2|nr:sulfotransferase family protein [Paracoccus sp. NBH48]